MTGLEWVDLKSASRVCTFGFSIGFRAEVLIVGFV